MNRLKDLWYFLRFALNYKARLAAYLAALALYSSTKAFPLYLMKNYLEIFFSDLRSHVPEIHLLTIVIASCGVAIGVFSYFYRYLGYYLSTHIGIDIKNALYNHFTGLPLSYFDKQEKGDLITRMTHDTGACAQIVKKSFVQFLPRTVEMIAAAVFCFVLCWQLAAVFFFFFPPLVALIRHFGRKISRRSMRSKQKLSEATVSMEQFFRAIKLIKSFHSHEREEEKFRNVNREFVKARMGMARVEARSLAVLELLGTWLMCVVILTGTYLLLMDIFALKPAVLLTFMGMFYLVSNKSRRVIQLAVEIIREYPSVLRLKEILATRSDIPVDQGGVELESIEPGVEFVNVRFGYEDGRDVIKGVTLAVKPGQMAAFVGPSGGGKTTLLDLVPRFYEVREGEIRIGGRNIKEIAPRSLLDRIAIVLQDSFIFNSSALENIRYGRPDASFEEVVEAARQANIHEEILRLPQ